MKNIEKTFDDIDNLLKNIQKLKQTLNDDELKDNYELKERCLAKIIKADIITANIRAWVTSLISEGRIDI